MVKASMVSSTGAISNVLQSTKSSFTIEKDDSCEEILESFYYRLESGEFSNYNIINEQEFLRTLEALFDEIDFSDDD
jgi:hypothetical protein